MSNNLMDTEPGGEQTQYEGAHNLSEPHNKQAGQLGDPATGTSTSQPKRATDEPNTQGVTKADKIRYGQSIQEGGMGGKTTSSTGQANDGGFGGTAAQEQQDDSFSKERREQGYGGGKDMDRNIGA
ncbi:hypothetical protein FB567DRAFT_519425 [Paraphoma chrysanthemicola]|uniref:Uncharacterized protein n=1 Tax=Paraphoma chrysanthemicola TaxID=798071 RepID=A0A8K0W0Y7_9PLEO|nr:hypothetical protein FB567DRAFT_519425 [Paraphoma chrysanthemicola]